MNSRIVSFKPVNRHLVIVPHFKRENKTGNGVLLPEDYKPEQERWLSATVVDVAADCSDNIKQLRPGYGSKSAVILVDRSMVEEISYKGKKFYIVLENYIMGILST